MFGSRVLTLGLRDPESRGARAWGTPTSPTPDPTNGRGGGSEARRDWDPAWALLAEDPPCCVFGCAASMFGIGANTWC